MTKLVSIKLLLQPIGVMETVILESFSHRLFSYEWETSGSPLLTKWLLASHVTLPPPQIKIRKRKKAEYFFFLRCSLNSTFSKERERWQRKVATTAIPTITYIHSLSSGIAVFLCLCYHLIVVNLLTSRVTLFLV